jgi:hypothetical protein
VAPREGLVQQPQPYGRPMRVFLIPEVEFSPPRRRIQQTTPSTHTNPRSPQSFDHREDCGAQAQLAVWCHRGRRTSAASAMSPKRRALRKGGREWPAIVAVAPGGHRTPGVDLFGDRKWTYCVTASGPITWPEVDLSRDRRHHDDVPRCSYKSGLCGVSLARKAPYRAPPLRVARQRWVQAV